MKALIRHVTKCVIAGIIVVLPVGGTVLSLVYIEDTLSESWLSRQPFYFPGLGILAVAAIVYLLGLLVTSFFGRWIWRGIDMVLERLPALGALYRTLKQILGYGKGEDAVFKDVVLVPSPFGGHEIGLVTSRFDDDGLSKLMVFVPGSPNPTSGRLVIAEPEMIRSINLTVHEALKSLVSVGASPVDDD